MTTTNDIDRGGRPRRYNEDELLERIAGLDDIALIRCALIDAGYSPRTAAACAGWLAARKQGDATGGASRRSATTYRKMLAEIPFDPLRPPGGRRKVLRELAAQRGSADLFLVSAGAAAGALALALFSPSEALRLAVVLSADNARTHPGADVEADSGASREPLRLVAASVARECVPGARHLSRPARAGCASVAA